MFILNVQLLAWLNALPGNNWIVVLVLLVWLLEIWMFSSCRVWCASSTPQQPNYLQIRYLILDNIIIYHTLNCLNIAYRCNARCIYRVESEFGWNSLPSNFFAWIKHFAIKLSNSFGGILHTISRLCLSSFMVCKYLVNVLYHILYSAQ